MLILDANSIIFMMEFIKISLLKILKKFLKLLSIEIFVNSFKEKKQKRNSSNLFNYNTNNLNKKK